MTGQRMGGGAGYLAAARSHRKEQMGYYKIATKFWESVAPEVRCTTAVLITLKLAGALDWSWWWIWLPSWAGGVVLGAMLLIGRAWDNRRGITR